MSIEIQPLETDDQLREAVPKTAPEINNPKIGLATRLFNEGHINIDEAAHLTGEEPENLEKHFTEKGILPRKKVLVCGGAGFIGSNFVHYMLEKYPYYEVVVYDKLTYAGNLENLRNVEKSPRYKFIKGDIADAQKVDKVVKEENIDYVVNFAAETHVTRSLLFDAGEFVRTNVLGTHSILEAVKNNNHVERFVHVSTDEVYGSLSLESTESFHEEWPFQPNVPYAAAKAGGDHLCRAYHNSYKVPVIVTHCSNNYGPFQHPEKLIPNALFRALRNQPITLHGNGQHVRDWIFVRDHCEALDLILHKGTVGDVYNIGADEEKNTHEIAKTVLRSLGKPENLVTLVDDRPGNDLRYSLNAGKIKEELGWDTSTSFEEGIALTIQWYQNNLTWVDAIRERDKEFSKYI